MAAGSYGLRGDRAARSNEGTGDPSGTAALRAPRPKSWSPPLPPHRVPIPPPPLAGSNANASANPFLPAPSSAPPLVGLARALPPPNAPEPFQSQVVPVA